MRKIVSDKKPINKLSVGKRRRQKTDYDYRSVKY